MNSLFIFLIWICLVATPAISEATPRWVETSRCNDTAATICAVGSSTNYQTQEDARSAAWNNALIQLARKQLPFLQSVREDSLETLNNTSYTRTSSLDAKDIDWSFIEEDVAQGSPYIVQTVEGQWRCSLILRWNRQHADSERSRLKEMMKVDLNARVISSLPIGDTSLGAGQLVVSSIPSGATVVIAGYTVGTSNAIINGIGKGGHDVVIKKAGYAPIEDKITMSPGQKIIRSYKLTKLSKIIRLSSKPSDAILFLNNRATKVNPSNEILIDYGVVSIRMEKPGYFPETRTLNVDEQTESLELLLRPMPGFLTVLPDIQGADIEVDGKKLAKGELTNYLAPGGIHSIRVTKMGYEPFVQEVFVNSIQGKTVLARLNFNAQASSINNKLADQQQINKKYLLRTAAAVFAVGSFAFNQEKQPKADRSACDKFSNSSSKSQCLERSDAIDNEAKNKNERNQLIVIGLGAASVVCLGLSFNF